MLTISKGWLYVEIGWLIKIKTDSAGNVHYEEWEQPHGKREPAVLMTVLTKPKILPVEITWLRVEALDNARPRYVMSGAVYQRLVEAVKP